MPGRSVPNGFNLELTGVMSFIPYFPYSQNPTAKISNSIPPTLLNIAYRNLFVSFAISVGRDVDFVSIPIFLAAYMDILAVMIHNLDKMIYLVMVYPMWHAAEIARKCDLSCHVPLCRGALSVF